MVVPGLLVFPNMTVSAESRVRHQAARQGTSGALRVRVGELLERVGSGHARQRAITSELVRRDMQQRIAARHARSQSRRAVCSPSRFGARAKVRVQCASIAAIQIDAGHHTAVLCESPTYQEEALAVSTMFAV